MSKEQAPHGTITLTASEQIPGGVDVEFQPPITASEFWNSATSPDLAIAGLKSAIKGRFIRVSYGPETVRMFQFQAFHEQAALLLDRELLNPQVESDTPASAVRAA